ncbi:hypothetical protein Tco_0567872 [Tanacetum coccineum]
MMTLKFADTHNMVAFLSKPEESDGFEQIVDFLNAHPIKYALTVNPIIYTSCIEQFWSTVKAKTVNEEVQLQALVDGKKIIVTEASARSDLQLDDEEGMDCLPNATIFEELTRMGYEKISQKLTFYKAFFSPQWKLLIHTILQCLSSKTTAWNKFSSTMASAIICLATNQKFVQVFLEKQLEGMSNHNRIHVAPSHTKKIFRNMKRVGKGFSSRVTPLFPTMVVQAQEEIGESSANPTDPYHTPTIIQPSTSQPQKTQKPRKPKRKDIEVPQPSGPITNVVDEAINEEINDHLVRAATTASILEAEQDSGNIIKTQSKATPNEPSSPGTSSGGGPRRQETMGDTIAQTRSENVSKLSNDPLLARGNALRSGEDSLKLKELMELCTNLQDRVIDLEKTKTSQAREITSLKRRVKRLKKKGGSRTHGLKRLYKVGLSKRVESFDEEGLGEENASKQGRIADIDADAGINLVSTHFDADIDLFGVHDLVGDEVVVETEVLTLAKALAELKSVKLPTTTAATTITAASTRPKAKGIVIHKQEQAPTLTFSSQQPLQLNVQNKEEEERLSREKAQQIEEVNIAWDDVQARVEASYQLAQRLQAQEQEELTDEEKSRLFVQFLEKRRKHFAAKRAEEKRNKPLTRAQQRSFMCTYLKKMEGWKPKDLKNKSFANIQELFDKAMKRVNTFVDYRTELVEESSKKTEADITQESSSKRSGTKLEQESIKKQKVDEDKETVEL